MRSAVGILLLILVSAAGFPMIGGYVGFGGGTFYGHLGYCSSVKLPFFHGICAAVMVLCQLLLMHYIYIEFFSSFKRLRAFYRWLLPFCLVVLGYITYSVLQFPYIDRHFGFLGQSDTQHGSRNTLMGLGAALVVLLGLLVLRFQFKSPLPKWLAIASFLLIIGFAAADIWQYRNAKYEWCYG